MDASEEKFVAYVTGTRRYNNKWVGISPHYRVTILSEGKYTERKEQNEQNTSKREVAISVTFLPSYYEPVLSLAKTAKSTA